jgi:hypothetical protein
MFRNYGIPTAVLYVSSWPQDFLMLLNLYFNAFCWSNIIFLSIISCLIVIRIVIIHSTFYNQTILF